MNFIKFNRNENLINRRVLQYYDPSLALQLYLVFYQVNAMYGIAQVPIVGHLPVWSFPWKLL